MSKTKSADEVLHTLNTDKAFNKVRLKLRQQMPDVINDYVDNLIIWAFRLGRIDALEEQLKK